ncbi:Fe2+-dependent dioxygenase [Polynucleobacter sp. MWH-Loch1C5]|uniref:Fe2+-dependent dioxygenase n=1 Tax=Polynucleobacter sp. MWH-Loch1C5 TaxID=2689108 RepID=UPI001C0AE286|nr:Fe2+-dependent dioxygenase [Polynucleobacter sp. MWH-Loch1C5]MBU3542971.1 Fe2+-dependent dioxygenase [Polynucleobacter sp. MWH-Loch1C5]
MLLHIPQVLTQQEIMKVRQIIDAADWADGSITAGTQSAKNKNNRQLPEDHPLTEEARQIVLRALSMNALYLTGALPKKIYPPLFNRYDGQQNSFGNHIDNSVRTHAATGRHVRTDVSCTLFLSEPEDYEGGELIIEDTYGSQAIKFAAGDMVLYPSSSVHRVEPVTSGSRIACFFWTESMIRPDEQRRLLYDLDMTIMQIRERYGDTPESIRLTGTYHNLLRMWADV